MNKSLKMRSENDEYQVMYLGEGLSFEQFGDLSDAIEVFSEMPEEPVVSLDDLLKPDFEKERNLSEDFELQSVASDIDDLMATSPKRLRLESGESVESNSTDCYKLLVKEGLKYHIQSKRLLSGQEELKVEFKPCETDKLTEMEVNLREERKGRNKVAAQKCREKKRNVENSLQEKIEVYSERNCILYEEIRKMRQERDLLAEILEAHMTYCVKEENP